MSSSDAFGRRSHKAFLRLNASHRRPRKLNFLQKKVEKNASDKTHYVKSRRQKCVSSSVLAHLRYSENLIADIVRQSVFRAAPVCGALNNIRRRFGGNCPNCGAVLRQGGGACTTSNGASVRVLGVLARPASKVLTRRQACGSMCRCVARGACRRPRSAHNRMIYFASILSACSSQRHRERRGHYRRGLVLR